MSDVDHQPSGCADNESDDLLGNVEEEMSREQVADEYGDGRG